MYGMSASRPLTMRPCGHTPPLGGRLYGLFLATNFGVSPWDALAVVPAERDYPVLFLTGHVTEKIEKAIPWHASGFDIGLGMPYFEAGRRVRSANERTCHAQ